MATANTSRETKMVHIDGIGARPDGLLATAHHEAGHAVVAVHLKVPFTGVSIEEDSDSAGQTYFSRSKRTDPELQYPLNHRMRSLIECRAIALMAGDAAERKFRPSRRFAGHSDKRHACELLSLLDEGQRALKLRVGLTRVLAEKVVDELWSEIEEVARALIMQKRLRAVEVQAIIDKTLANEISNKMGLTCALCS